MKSIPKLAELIAEFPGVGPRQARRIVQFLLEKPQSYRNELAQAIAELSKDIARCALCFRYDETNAKKLCHICADESREASLLVVERDVDIDAVESSGAYRGKYFVLGGLIPMAKQKKNGKEARVKELTDRIASGSTSEVILALSTTPEGDYTAREIISKLKALSTKLAISMLGRGLSVGAEIEYADSETLRNALMNRG